ncbi:MAG: hypothetical protein ABIP19_06295 [Dermatophilaceae bacterium]
MTRTLDDLRGALQAEADDAAYAGADALVAGARRRVAASRRRRLGVLAAATVAVMVAGGLGFTRPTHQAVPQPADPGPFTVSAGVADFPDYLRGMRRLTVVEAPMLERVKGSITVPTTPGQVLAVSMICSPQDNVENLGEWNARMAAKFTAPGTTGRTACGLPDEGYDPIGVVTGTKTLVVADIFISHLPSPSLPTLFKDAKMRVAFYGSVPFNDYPLPPRPADFETDPNSAWSSEPGTVRILGPKTAQEANKLVTFTQPSDPKLLLHLQIRGPGRLRVLINGKDVTRRIAASMLTEDRFITSWGYDRPAGFQIPLEPEPFASLSTGTAAPPTKPGTPVTVTIEPQDFVGPDWRIVVQPNPTTR